MTIRQPHAALLRQLAAVRGQLVQAGAMLGVAGLAALELALVALSDRSPLYGWLAVGAAVVALCVGRDVHSTLKAEAATDAAALAELEKR